MGSAQRNIARRGAVAGGTAAGLRGFTLIELLIVVVLIGLIALIALPRFSGAREKAYRAQVATDIHALIVAQEAYFDNAKSYAVDLALLDYNQTKNVQIEILETAGNGWSAKGTHDSEASIECGFYTGPVTPPVIPGIKEGRLECKS
jgi:prepilin-type N-terminal cleavage/methylation domain-containing protein